MSEQNDNIILTINIKKMSRGEVERRVKDFYKKAYKSKYSQINSRLKRDIDIDYYSFLGSIYYNENYFEIAQEYCEKALALNPVDPYLLQLNKIKCSILMENKKWKEAYYYVINSFKTHPNDEWLLYNKAYIERRLNINNQAVQTLKLLLKINPIHHDGLIMLGNYFLENQRFDLAISNYSKALEIKLNDIDTLLCIGRAHLLKKDTKNAVQYFERIIKVEPNNFLGWYHCGAAYFMLRDSIKVKKCINRLVELEPQSEIVYKFMSNYYWSVSDYNKALESLEYALKINPHNKDNIISKAFLLYKKGSFIESLELYLFLLKDEPNNSQILQAIGLLYERLDNFKLSIEYLEKALEIDSKNHNVWRGFAIVYYNMGGKLNDQKYTSLSQTFLDIALAFNPHDPFIWGIQALISIGLKDYPGAIKSLEKYFSYDNYLRRFHIIAITQDGKYIKNTDLR